MTILCEYHINSINIICILYSTCRLSLSPVHIGLVIYGSVVNVCLQHMPKCIQCNCSFIHVSNARIPYFTQQWLRNELVLKYHYNCQSEFIPASHVNHKTNNNKTRTSSANTTLTHKYCSVPPYYATKSPHNKAYHLTSKPEKTARTDA